MTGRWIEARAQVHTFAEQISDDDGCVACGFAFAYGEEGCDECAPIKRLLEVEGRLHSDSERS